MNLFENLQLIKESNYVMSNDEFVKSECEKYGIIENSYGTNYKRLDLDPTDSSAEEFINKIEADGYKFIEEQKDGIENHESENDVTLVYGKEVEGNRCVIAISIHPSENYTVISCGYDEAEGDNEFFENLQNFNEETSVSNKNKNSILRQAIELLSEIKDKTLIPKECNKLIKEIYDKTLELRSLIEDDNEIKTEAPGDFLKKVNQAKETLSHYSTKQVNFVKKAYEEVLADISDSFISERGTNMSQIKNDYMSIATEDNLMTAEEFETIFKSLEVIGTFYSHANA